MWGICFSKKRKSKWNKMRIISKIHCVILNTFLMFFLKQHLWPTFTHHYCHDGMIHSLGTHLKFIQSLYSRSEAKVAHITGKRRLPILTDRKAETLTPYNTTSIIREWQSQPCNSEQIEVSQGEKKSMSRAYLERLRVSTAVFKTQSHYSYRSALEPIFVQCNCV